jgi:GTP-binding protein EngB required for normal cell division
MQRLAKAITKAGFIICATYCADGTFINEPSKYISACLTALSTMTQLNVPHLNILTKCDKLKEAKQLTGDEEEETLLD